MYRAMIGCAVFAALCCGPALATIASGIAPGGVPSSTSGVTGLVAALHATGFVQQASPSHLDAPAALRLGFSYAVEKGLRPPVTLVLKVDLAKQNVTVIERGTPLQVWAISSGRREFATPTGTFRPGWMAKIWYSRQYDDAPMPHAIFFNGGIAFHGTAAVKMLGRPASHGCVRLAPAHAAHLYALVRKHGLTQTKVIVHGTPAFTEPAIARNKTRSPATDFASAKRPTGKPSFFGQPYSATQWSFSRYR